MGCYLCVYEKLNLFDINIREGLIILGYNIITPNGKVKKLRVADSEQRSKAIAE